MMDQGTTLIHTGAIPLGPEYPIPSDQECMGIGGHAHQAFPGAGDTSDSHIDRDGIRQLSTGTGGRYMQGHRSTGHESQYSSGSVSISDSSSTSISTSPSSAASSIAYPPFQSTFQPPNTLYPGASQVIPNSLGYPQSVNGVAHLRSSVPPLSSGSANAVITSSHASTIRDHYSTTTPGLARYGFSPRSHAEPLRAPFGITETPRSIIGGASLALSSQPGLTYTPQYQIQTTEAQMAGEESRILPFEPIKKFHTITCDNGPVEPHIEAKMEKGFFYSRDNCWTCYRRNYFSVQCSFTLHPHTPQGSLFLNRDGKSPQRVQATAMSLSATADGTEGKKIELVQHTAKRDKGPQTPVGKIKVAPTPPGRQHAHDSYHLPHHYMSTPMASFNLPFQSIVEKPENPPRHAQPGQSSHPYAPGAAAHGHQSSALQPAAGTEPPCQYTFERIQFKSATANNGKRRAQQQYYHLIVELFVDIRNPHDSEPTWVKVAQRASASVVVRGRSPSHYQNEGPQSHGTGRSGAPGMGGALDGHHHHGSLNGLQGRGMGGLDFGSGRSSGMMGGYRGTGYYVDTSPGGSHTPSSASSISGITMDGLVEQSHTPHSHHHSASILTDDDEIKEKHGHMERYQYYPAPLFEPGMANGQKYEYDATSSGVGPAQVKEEPEHTLASVSSHAAVSGGPAWMRSCGKFQPSESSRGYYPDLNTTGY